MTLHPETSPRWLLEPVSPMPTREDWLEAITQNYIAGQALLQAERSGIGYREARERFDATVEIINEISGRWLMAAIKEDDQ